MGYNLTFSLKRWVSAQADPRLLFYLCRGTVRECSDECVCFVGSFREYASAYTLCCSVPSDGPWLSLNVTGKHVAYVCMWPTPPNHTYWWVAIEVVVV